MKATADEAFREYFELDKANFRVQCLECGCEYWGTEAGITEPIHCWSCLGENVLVEDMR